MKKTYFENLNYTLANEDAALEHSLLGERSAHVVAVSGSGGRVLPLLARNPARISIVDVSPVQLAVCELRIEAVRAMSHEQYLAFWGFYEGMDMSPSERKLAFESLPLTLSNRPILQKFFEENEWKSILLCGRWERTFQFFSKMVRLFFGESVIKNFFAIRTLDEQRAFLAKDFPNLRWRVLLALIGNARTFNALLYKGSFPVKNIPGSMLAYYLGAFNRLFAQAPARANFFLQLCFLGRLQFQEGVPVEAKPEIFAQAKQALQSTRVEYIESDLIKWVAALAGRPTIEHASFVSLSNVPSYFTGDLESSFLQRIKPGLSEGAQVVIRNYMRCPEGLEQKGYQDITHRFGPEIAAEKMQMYQVQVLSKQARPGEM